MILVFDIGNTETTVGVFDGERLHAHWRLVTDVNRTPDEIDLQIRGLLSSRDIAIQAITGTAVGSVVPALTGPMSEACEGLFGTPSVIVDARSKLPITLDVLEPLTVGADRIVNTLAASRLFARDTIVVDLGTATTYDCITADGVFLGGVIAPGMRTSAETLFRRTSKLPATELVAPERVIGRRTETVSAPVWSSGRRKRWDGLVRRII
jgi:type III pantothenate kinase